MEIQELRTFGRRHGKKLSIHKQWLLDNILPTLNPMNLKSNKPQILEIGFGNGEHLINLAEQYPDIDIVGAEPFINGVAALLSYITQNTNTVLKTYKNIHIYPDDIRLLLHLSEYSDVKFKQIWILHPDPWPKKRHIKRRLLSTQFFNLLSQHLTIDGEIIIGTDHWEYYDWIKEQIPKNQLYIKSDALQIIETRYQQKNKAGTNRPKYLVLGQINI